MPATKNKAISLSENFDVGSPEANSAVKAAKANGINPVFITIAGGTYIYKTITRKEWRQLRKDMQAKLVEAGEDEEKLLDVKEDELLKLLNLAKVYYQEGNIDDLPAGVVDSLADSILISSGFGGAEIEPIKL